MDNFVMDVKVNDGESGDWGLMKTNGMFITSVSSKYQDKISNGDNTGLNGIKFSTANFVCRTDTILG